ncbi:MAG: glycosyltransferase family 2 protein [Spirochaetes bacterium]|nr:glycosyltransferase family 2 protein [Spirochaetota bacterium]
MKQGGASKKTAAKPYISIVLPVFNEEENVERQYRSIVEAMAPSRHSYEIVFIDDGSSDRSVPLLRGIAKKDPRVKIVVFRRNFGQTAAMAAGIDFSSGEIIVFMDSDLQNDASDIDMLVAKIEEGYDVVSGWRKNRQDRFFSRKLPSRIANRLIARVTGVHIHDLGCSLKAYRGEILRQVNLYGEMHRFIPVHASWIGARITEVPVKHHARMFGKSKYGIKRTFKVLLDLITVKFLGKYSTKPIYVFGGTGFILLFFSGLSGIAVILMKFLLGQSMIRNPLLLLTVMLIILSVLFVQIGILAEIMIRIYHEAQDMSPYRVLETVNIRKR